METHGPMGRYTFVAMLFLMAACGLMMGGMALYENALFRFQGRDADMVATDPPKWLIARDGQYFPRRVNVKYVGTGKDGTHVEVPVPGKYVSAEEVRRLAQGERIPVRYLEGAPERARTAGDDGDNPWGWLIAGALSLGLALYARTLLHRESRRR